MSIGEARDRGYKYHVYSLRGRRQRHRHRQRLPYGGCAVQILEEVAKLRISLGVNTVFVGE